MCRPHLAPGGGIVGRVCAGATLASGSGGVYGSERIATSRQSCTCSAASRCTLCQRIWRRGGSHARTARAPRARVRCAAARHVGHASAAWRRFCAILELRPLRCSASLEDAYAHSNLTARTVQTWEAGFWPPPASTSVIATRRARTSEAAPALRRDLKMECAGAGADERKREERRLSAPN